VGTPRNQAKRKLTVFSVSRHITPLMRLPVSFWLGVPPNSSDASSRYTTLVAMEAVLKKPRSHRIETNSTHAASTAAQMQG
jgi:hypothetical protein